MHSLALGRKQQRYTTPLSLIGKNQLAALPIFGEHNDLGHQVHGIIKTGDVLQNAP